MKHLAPLLILLALLMGSSVAIAKDNFMKQGDETIMIRGGAFFPYFDTSISVDNRNIGDGTNIDLEDDLNLDESTFTYFAQAYWRFAERHRLYVGYMTFGRDAGATLTEELEIGDTTFPIDAGVETEFDLSILPVSYGYSFIKNEKHELTGTVGIHWYHMDISFTGYATPGNATFEGSASAKANAPMPLIGFNYNYHFSDRWTIGLTGKAFALSLDDDTFSFDGSVLSCGVNTEYWLFNNVALGAAINYFRLDIEADESNWAGELTYEYVGPQAYLAVRF